MSEALILGTDAVTEIDTVVDNDEENEVDWQRLSSLLSPDIFAALHSHLIGGEDDQSDAAVSRIPSTVDNTVDNTVKSSNTVKYTPNNAAFKEQGYWDERFAEEDEYDWLLTYDQLQTHLIPLLSVSDSILIVGCGNSSLSAGLYDAGFTNITNIDYSQIVIDRMKAVHGIERPLMKWEFMDMTDMKFLPGSFDVVIDKASMDALMVDEGDVWDPNTATIEISDKMCLGISKILTLITGQFIQLSFAQPHFRTKYLMGQHVKDEFNSEKISQFESSEGYCEKYGWTLSFSTIITEAGCLNSFLYVMKIK